MAAKKLGTYNGESECKVAPISDWQAAKRVSQQEITFHGKIIQFHLGQGLPNGSPSSTELLVKTLT
jgi:hypothetical protein